MHLYIVSGILLVIPIIDFALAAPVLVQEKRQACADIANIPEYPVTVLGKRGGAEEVVDKYVKDWFAKPEESSAIGPSSSSPPSITEGLPPESDHELTGVHAPLSSPVLPNWFLTDHGYMGPHAPKPKLGPSDHALVVEEPPSRPESPSVSYADHGYQVVHAPPPSAPDSALPTTESDYEVVDVPPSSSVSSTKPSRRSMGEVSRLENLQAVSGTLEGKAKESRHISGTARDVLNATQRKLQRDFA